MRAEEHSLEPHHRRVTRGDMGDGLDPHRPLDRDGRHQSVHPGPSHRVVVHVHEADDARVAQRPRHRDHRIVRATLRGVELDADDPVSLSQRPRELCLPSRRCRCRRLRAFARLERGPRCPLVVERCPDRFDLGGRGAAAAADDPGAERDSLRGEVTKVLGCRVGVHDAPADDARKTDVRESCKG